MACTSQEHTPLPLDSQLPRDRHHQGHERGMVVEEKKLARDSELLFDYDSYLFLGLADSPRVCDGGARCSSCVVGGAIHHPWYCDGASVVVAIHHTWFRHGSCSRSVRVV